MISLPILPGMRAISYHSIPCRAIAIAEKHGSPSPDGYYEHDIDYSDPATCGALMAWCYRELRLAIDATHKPLRPKFNIARVALDEARPWNPDSVKRAVKAVCEALDNS